MYRPSKYNKSSNCGYVGTVYNIAARFQIKVTRYSPVDGTEVEDSIRDPDL